MSEPRRCPQCDAEISANSPAGLCPRCLLKASADSQSVSPDPGPTKLTPPASGFVPPTVEELAPLFPQLEILEVLGKGGMGAVYKARQPGLDRLVALKILPPEISHDPAFAERFQREARALARLSHPHIVAVYDFGQTLECGDSSPLSLPGSATSRQAEQLSDDAAAKGWKSGDESPHSKGALCYIVMEFVDGANLRQTIRAGKLAPAEALAIVPQICEALQFAHDEGIVHRDIKPENILIDKRGRVKIADFGLAKLLGTDGSDHSLTGTHQVMGTLRYMAPEQMQGSREVDHRADIYSLGVVFYELLTGELPMGKFAPPSKKVQVDVRLDEVVLRALEQDPEQRYQHASEVKSEIDTISRTPLPASVARPESSKGVASRDMATATPFDDSERATRPQRWDSAICSWWFAQSDGRRQMLWIVLCGVFVVSLFLFFSFSGRSNFDGSYHYAIGAFDPWFVHEQIVDQGRHFGSRSGLLSGWSWLFGILAFASGWLVFKLRSEKTRSQPRSVDVHSGTPVTQMRFMVADSANLAPQALFHFSSLGYELVEQRADVCVFHRGGKWAGLWEFNIRNIATRLTVRTAPATDGQRWVSCDWSVRTLGAWITRRDIRQLESEGEGFKTLLVAAAPTQLPMVDSATSARLSRHALVGAIWVPLLFLAGVTLWVLQNNRSYIPGEYSGPAWWESALMFTVLPLGALAPIGTTICGAVAIGKIKRSEGKLYGLRLAQADALLFPLLVLGAAAFLAGFLIVRGPMRGLPPVSGLDEWFYQSPRQEFVALLIALPIWFFPARALFRAVVGPRDAFDLRKLPLVGDEPLTGKAALVVALAAIAAHGWPWHWIIPPNSTARTISNFDMLDGLQSFWLLVLSIGLALFASAASLARPAKLILHIGSAIAVIAALVIQVRFYRSLGEFEPNRLEKVVRLIRTYTHMGVYVTMALTGLALLFFVLRIFEERSDPVAGDEGILSPERRVKAPAIWLLLTGLFAVVQGVVLLIFMGLLFSKSQFSHGELVLYRILGAALVAAGIVIGIGAWQMLQLRGYRWAITAAILGQPLGIWSLVVLTRRDVKAAFEADADSRRASPRPFSSSQPDFAAPLKTGGSKMGLQSAVVAAARPRLVETPQEQRERQHAWWGAITAAVLMFAVLIFTALAMWVTGSVWCLLALCVPAFIAPCLENVARRAGTLWIFFATAVLSLIGSLALIAYGVWLTESLWPLFAIVAPFVGMGAGVAAWQGEDESDETTTTERSDEPEGVSPRTADEQVRGLTPAGSQSVRVARPKLVPVLATFNLIGAILLMLVCAMEEPAAFSPSDLRVWQLWEKVDAVLGFTMAAGMFAASIGLFLWKPWARKLTLGVCVFGLASFVFDAPYLARFAIPDLYAEIQQTITEEGIEPDARDFVAMFTVVVLLGGIMVVALTWLVGQLMYFTRPGVVAAFESQGESESYGKFLDWLCTGAGAVAGVVSVFLPLVLWFVIFPWLIKGSSGEKMVEPAADRTGSKTGEQWSGNKGEEHVMFLGPNSPTVSDRLALHLGLDAAQREAMNQAFQEFFRDFKALEEQNTRHETDANGHQITTIAAFGSQVPALAERFWTELDSVLDGRQLTLGRKTVGLGLGMFESVFTYQVEIWRVGQVNPWYQWKESYPGRANFTASPDIEPSSGPELPEKLRRFWKESGPNEATDASIHGAAELGELLA